MSEIVECRDFNCEHNENFKCKLKKVKLVVIQGELCCESAEEDEEDN